MPGVIGAAAFFQRAAAARAHDLIAGPREEIAERGGKARPDMHQPRKREQHGDDKAKEDVQLEQPVHVHHRDPGVHVPGDHALRPLHEPDHLGPIHVLKRLGDRQKADGKLQPDQDHNQDVERGGGGADSWIGQPSVYKHCAANQRGQPCRPADQHRHPLLQPVRYPKGIQHPDRREQPDKVAKEHRQDADMEQDRAPHQLLAAQQLAGRGFPGEGIALIARDRAHQEHRQRDIGHDPEDDEIDVETFEHVMRSCSWRPEPVSGMGRACPWLPACRAPAGSRRSGRARR